MCRTLTGRSYFDSTEEYADGGVVSSVSQLGPCLVGWMVCQAAFYSVAAMADETRVRVALDQSMAANDSPFTVL